MGRARRGRGGSGEGRLELEAAAVLERVVRAGRGGVPVRQLVDEALGDGLSGRARSEIRRELKATLKRLEAEGRLAASGHRLVATDAAEVVRGRLRMTSSGEGRVDAGRGQEPVTVPPRALRGALDGDLVLVRLERPPKRARGVQPRLGAVMRVVDRRRRTVVGRYEERGGQPRVVPVDRRLRLEVRATGSEVGEAIEDGDLVVVSLDEVSALSTSARGTLLERLGRPDDPATVERVVVREYGLAERFSPASEAEAAALPAGIGEADLAGRWDLRDRPAVTIDAETARDFDDAVSARPGRPARSRSGPHRRRRPLRAPRLRPRPPGAERGTSVYLPGRCVPMLPEQVSSQLCCLRPEEDRLAFTVRFLVRPRRQRRAGYRGAAVGDPLPPALHLHRGRRLARAAARRVAGGDRRRRATRSRCWPRRPSGSGRARRGARQPRLRPAEPEIRLDPGGHGRCRCGPRRNRAHRLIEELMVAANSASPRCSRGRPARPAPGPRAARPARVEELRGGARELRPDLPGDLEELPPGALQAAAGGGRGPARAALAETLVLRSLARACYSPECKRPLRPRHSTTTSTSPPDPPLPGPGLPPPAAASCSPRRGAAQAEERARSAPSSSGSAPPARTPSAGGRGRAEVVQVKQTLLYLRRHVARGAHGHVSGVTPFGVFVPARRGPRRRAGPRLGPGRRLLRYDERRHRLVGRRAAAVLPARRPAPGAAGAGRPRGAAGPARAGRGAGRGQPEARARPRRRQPSPIRAGSA